MSLPVCESVQGSHQDTGGEVEMDREFSFNKADPLERYRQADGTVDHSVQMGWDMWMSALRRKARGETLNWCPVGFILRPSASLWVYDTDGLCPCQRANQHKDPPMIMVRKDGQV